MNSYLPKLNPDGNVKPTFNPVDFKWIYDYVSYADLLNYANLYSSNIFYGANTFPVITFSDNLNGISPLTFSYLENTSSNIQAQLNDLQNKTTRMTYDGQNITNFSGTLASQVIRLNNMDLNSRITLIETDVSGLKTKTTNQSYSNNKTTFSGTLSVPIIELNGTNLDSRLIIDETDISNLKGQMTTANTNISTLQNQMTSANTNLSTLQTQMTTANNNITSINNSITSINTALNSKTDDSQVVHIGNSETITGIKNFTQRPTYNLINIATVDDISSSISQLVGGASSAYDSLIEIQNILQSNGSSITTILNSMVNIGGTQTITGQKSFNSQTTYFNSISASSSSTFQGITSTSVNFTTSLNSIPPTVFNYLSNVSSDIQTQFQSLYTRLTNYQYYSDTNTQSFNSSTGVLNNFITNNIITNNINTNSINSSSIYSSDINCSNIKISNIEKCFPYPIIYITNQTYMFPILKNGLISNLKGLDFQYPLFITIAPNYRLLFLNANNSALAEIKNTTDDYLYNIGISFTSQTPFKFKVSQII